ncbi:hypothetical protein ACHWQZ_G009088 [Mnemiopsis leidyi]
MCTQYLSKMEELRKSNQELLKKLRIGQTRAWNILNESSAVSNQRKDLNELKESKFQPPYTFSTPTKTFVELLDKASTDRIARASPTITVDKDFFDKDQSKSPLSDILNLHSSRNHGRPHKNASSKDFLDESANSPFHSPHCTENHRERLHQKLNASYSKLAADLRQIAPCYGADLAYNLSENSVISNKPDSYYDELKKFRMANSDLCTVKLPDTHDAAHSAFLTEDQENYEGKEEENHQCIQTYSIGHGYRAVDSHSGGQCPLCIGADDTKHKGLIRVNIQHKDLVDYKVHPRDAEDSVSLSSHCSMGWEHTSTHYKSAKKF